MTIFEDMKLLFDSTVKDINVKIGGERQHFEKLIHKLYSETQDRLKAQERTMENNFGLKLNRVERFVDALVFDVAQLQSKQQTIGVNNTTAANNSPTTMRSDRVDIDLNDMDTLFPPRQLDSSEHAFSARGAY